MNTKSVQANLDWLISLPPDWRDPLSAYLEGYVAAALEESTLCSYNNLLRPMIRWAVDQKISFAQFGPRQADAYSVMRRTMDKVSDRTRRSEIFVLKAFFRFCRIRRYRKSDPLREYAPPKAARAYVPCPTEDDLKRLLASVKERWSGANPKMKSVDIGRRKFYSCRTYALFCLLIETGARVDEILSLQLKDYTTQPDPSGKKRSCIIVREAKGDMWRIIPVTGEGKVAEALATWLRVRPKLCPSDYIFVNDEGEKMGYRALAKTFSEQLIYAGLSHFTIHSIRHYTTSTHGRVNLNDASKIAGHKDIKTTEIYLKHDLDDLRETHEVAAPLDRLFRTEKKREHVKRKRVF